MEPVKPDSTGDEWDQLLRDLPGTPTPPTNPAPSAAGPEAVADSAASSTTDDVADAAAPSAPDPGTEHAPHDQQRTSSDPTTQPPTAAAPLSPFRSRPTRRRTVPVGRAGRRRPAAYSSPWPKAGTDAAPREAGPLQPSHDAVDVDQTEVSFLPPGARPASLPPLAWPPRPEPSDEDGEAAATSAQERALGDHPAPGSAADPAAATIPESSRAPEPTPPRTLAPDHRSVAGSGGDIRSGTGPHRRPMTGPVPHQPGILGSSGLRQPGQWQREAGPTTPPTGASPRPVPVPVPRRVPVQVNPHPTPPSGYGPHPSGPIPLARPGAVSLPPTNGAAVAVHGAEHAIAPLEHALGADKHATRPRQGWRGALYAATGGSMNLKPSRREVEYRDLLARIGTPLSGTHRITTASLKGGVGKTTVSALLGLELAEHRGDRVIVLDANPDAGTLADRVVGAPVTVTVRNLVNEIGRRRGLRPRHEWHLTDVARYTTMAGRLAVLASEQDPAMSESFDRDEYVQVTGLLQQFYQVIITDSGTGLVHSAMHGALEETNTLVIVGAPTVDGAGRAAKTLDWLSANGFGDLVSTAIVVLSFDRFNRQIDLRSVVAHFQHRCRAVVELPADEHLAAGGHIQLDQLRKRTQRAGLELAAHVGDQFGWPSKPRGRDPAAARPRPGLAPATAPAYLPTGAGPAPAPAPQPAGRAEWQQW